MEGIIEPISNTFGAMVLSVLQVVIIYIVLPYFVVGAIGYFLLRLRGKNLQLLASIGALIGLFLFLKYGIAEILELYNSKMGLNL